MILCFFVIFGHVVWFVWLLQTHKYRTHPGLNEIVEQLMADYIAEGIIKQP